MKYDRKKYDYINWLLRLLKGNHMELYVYIDVVGVLRDCQIFMTTRLPSMHLSQACR